MECEESARGYEGLNFHPYGINTIGSTNQSESKTVRAARRHSTLKPVASDVSLGQTSLFSGLDT